MAGQPNGVRPPESPLRRLLKSIPGTRTLARAWRSPNPIAVLVDATPGLGWCFRSFVRTPGSFLFRDDILSWLADAELRDQLPPLYRAFARYCSGGPRNAQGVAWGSESLFRLVAACTRILGLQDFAELRIRSDAGVETVCLNLLDARSLCIPNEIRDVRALLADYLRPGDSFIDVGANHGSFSIVASRLVGAEGQVVSVEPQPRLAGSIRRALTAAGTSPFTILEAALSDEAGEATFYVPRSTSGSAGLFRAYSARAAAEAFQVRVARFDDAVDWRALPGRVVMKLDVEGSEFRFLEGAREAILARNPCLFLEINPTSLRASDVAGEQLARRLERLGYAHYVAEGDSTVRELEELDTGVAQNVVLLSKREAQKRSGAE